MRQRTLPRGRSSGLIHRGRRAGAESGARTERTARRTSVDGEVSDSSPVASGRAVPSSRCRRPSTRRPPCRSSGTAVRRCADPEPHHHVPRPPHELEDVKVPRRLRHRAPLLALGADDARATPGTRAARSVQSGADREPRRQMRYLRPPPHPRPGGCADPVVQDHPLGLAHLERAHLAAGAEVHDGGVRRDDDRRRRMTDRRLDVGCGQREHAGHTPRPASRVPRGSLTG